ncbi:MAG TPA: hypothetical protein PKE59_00105 [Novosphingobium sp.]|jgi:hypothetical protein|nr:hypothetical protein [Novosphingobium sp.]
MANDRALLSAKQVEDLNRDLGRIRDLDTLVESLCKDAAREHLREKWGDGIRTLFGGNRLHPAPVSSALGVIAARGIADWALAERAEIAKRICGLVEVRDPPAIDRMLPRDGMTGV